MGSRKFYVTIRMQKTLYAVNIFPIENRTEDKRIKGKIQSVCYREIPYREETGIE